MFSLLLIHQSVKSHVTSQREFSKVLYKNIYSDIFPFVLVCFLHWSTLSSEDDKHDPTHMDVCQRHLSRLVAAKDGWSESLISYCLHDFLT